MTVRVVLKTSESDYVDGMQLTAISVDGKVKLDENYYEQTPEYQGGEIIPAIDWINQLKGSVDYIRILEPEDIKAININE